MVKVEDLVKVYPGGVKALNGVSFSAERGAILGLLGPNGAGKTTAIRIISGYISPDRGNVFIEDVNLLNEPSRAKALIGYMPEVLSFYPELKVREYLEFRAYLKGVPFRALKRELDRVMDLAFIKDVENKLVSGLSKGYRQRLGFADALLGSPKVIILDEPTIGLDPNQIIRFRESLKAVSRDAVVIFSSHILQEVEALCDDVVIIDRGQVRAQGKKEDLLSSYKERKFIVEAKIGDLSCLEGFLPYTVEPIQDGWVRLSFSVQEDIREEIFRRIVSCGGAIRRMEWERSDLEDLFVSLTS